MKTLGVFANCSKPRAAEVLARLSDKARNLGLRLFADKTSAALLKAAEPVEVPEMLDRVEAVLALGGDGTMLRAARELGGHDKPIIGVNIGGLGFLTSVAEADLERALECLAADNFSTSHRSMAECVVRRGDKTLSYRALNDVVLGSGGSARIVTLHVSIEGEDVTSFVCDGLIVSTPTGSTGHSLSAGGPIIIPESQVLVLGLICAHTLSTRPLVVPDRSVISVTVVNSGGGLMLSVDGQVDNALEVGDRVDIRRSEESVRFIHLPGYSYFSVLRHKLHWRGSNV